MNKMEEIDMNSFQNALKMCNKDQSEPVKFQEYQIDTITANHPLTRIFEERSWSIPCLFVSHQHKASKELTSPVSHITTTPIKSQNGYHDANESYDGSPLKLQQFDVDISISIPDLDGSLVKRKSYHSKYSHNPLDITSARTLLSVYQQCQDTSSTDPDNNNTESSNILPIWILCKGCDPEQHILLGSHIERYNDKICYCLSDLTVHGPVTSDCRTVRQAWCKRPPFCHDGKNVKTKCFAKYIFLGVTSHIDTLDASHQKSLEVHFHWTRLTSLLQAPPVEANTVVKATVAIGDVNSPTNFVYRELKVLKCLVEGIKKGAVEWAARIEDKPLRVRIESLVRDAEAGLTYMESKEANKADDTLFLKAADDAIITPREELDFTEEMWLILKDCSSLQDLVSYIQFVLDHLNVGDLQPVVHRDNKTKLGQLIRDSYYNKITVPTLEGTLPVQMLVEIGLEKMSNDYTHIFLELVTMDSIEKFVRDNGTSHDRLTRLYKLQHTLELVSMIHTLGLPKIILSIAARQALKYYETNAISKGHTFTIPVKTTSIKSSMERLELTSWHAEVSTQKADQDVYVLYTFTEKSPFDHIHYDTSDDAVFGDLDKSFYLSTLVKDVIVL